MRDDGCAEVVTPAEDEGGGRRMGRLGVGS